MTDTTHCHFCGGFIRNPATIQYQPPRMSAQVAAPTTEPCTCSPPIVYEDPPVMNLPGHDVKLER